MNALTAQLSTLVQRPLPHACAPAHPPLPSVRQPESVRATVNYTHPDPRGEQLFQYAYALPDGTRPNNLRVDAQQVEVFDIHTAQRHFSLQRNGFQLESLPVASDIDWSKDDQVQELYYPAVEELIKRVSGATDVMIFDHTIRRGRAGQDANGAPVASSPQRTPVSRAHVDYNTVSGRQRLHQLLPEAEAAARSERPFAIIQVWRPLRGPVKESPLAMVDASAVEKDDLIDLRLELEGRTGYNYAVKHNPAHRWYYAKDMRADEAYVFTCYDSRSGRARFTPHTGFTDPTTPPDAPQRESIEIRAYAFWGNEPQQPIALDL